MNTSGVSTEGIFLRISKQSNSNPNQRKKYPENTEVSKKGIDNCHSARRPERHIDRYLKNGVSKSIVHVIKHANFEIYRVHPERVI